MGAFVEVAITVAERAVLVDLVMNVEAVSVRMALADEVTSMLRLPLGVEISTREGENDAESEPVEEWERSRLALAVSESAFEALWVSKKVRVTVITSDLVAIAVRENVPLTEKVVVREGDTETLFDPVAVRETLRVESDVNDVDPVGRTVTACSELVSAEERVKVCSTLGEAIEREKLRDDVRLASRVATSVLVPV